MNANNILAREVNPKDIDRISKIIRITKWVSKQCGGVRRILDLGCKNGGLTAILKQVTGAEEVWGADISEEDLECATLKGIQTLKADLNIDRLKFQSERFDMVTCFEVIYYLHDPDFFGRSQSSFKAYGNICTITKKFG